MSEPRTDFQRLPETVGQVVHGEPFSFDAADSALFHQVTWLDRAYPDEQPEFPDTLVEGFWLLGMVDAVSRLAVTVDRSMWGLNYGLDSVRFISPVHFGDLVLSTFETLQVVPKDGGYKVLRRCTFQVEDAETPAMVADWWSYVLPSGTVERARRTADEAVD